MCCRVMTFTFDAQVAKQTRNIGWDIFFLPKTAQVSSKNTPSLSGVARRDLLWNVKEMSSWNLTFLPSASRWRKAVVIQMFGIKRDKKRRRINEGKKRLAVWFLRMAVYYQARSAEEINRHHLESKCPNIMKGMRTEAWWNMTFSKKENIFFSFWSLFIYFSCYLVGCATFVYIKGAPLCTHSSSSHAFFGAPFISWRHAELSVLPKEFPPALYWRGERSGLCQRALWSQPVWRLHSDPLTSRKPASMPVHISSDSPFFSSSICPSYASVLFPSTWSGWEPPPTQALVTNCLSWEWLSLRSSFASSASALESALLPTRNTASAVFTLLFTHFFPPSKPGWTQLLSSQGAQRKLSQAANWLAELLHLFRREQSWWSHGADVCCVHVRVCAG